MSIREGSVHLQGEDITNLKANKLVQAGVGFVPQTNNVFPSLSIEENLQMGLYLRRRSSRNGSRSSTTSSRSSGSGGTARRFAVRW